MNHPLSVLGFFLDFEEQPSQATARQLLEEVAMALGRVDMRPEEFYEEVVALIDAGVENPQALADAVLRLVR